MGIYMNPIEFDELGAINPISDLNSFECDFSEQNILSMIGKAIESVRLAIIDGYIGVSFGNISAYCQDKAEIISVQDYFYKTDRIAELTAPFLPTDKDIDPCLLFGSMCDMLYDKIIDYARIKNDIEERLNKNIKVILVGSGAYSELLSDLNPTVFYIDLTPKELAVVVNHNEYKSFARQGNSIEENTRAIYFVDVEIANAARKVILEKSLIQYYLTQKKGLLNSFVSIDELKTIANEVTSKPFRARPVYLDGVWGGQFMKRERNIPDDLAKRVAWSFELLPMEVSVLCRIGKELIDIPFYVLMNLVSKRIIGLDMDKQYSGYFPIRINYDDTWHGAGNMSIQCHPNSKQAKTRYNELGGQNEAYYVVLTGHDAKIFCGFEKDGNAFLDLCKKAEIDGELIDYEEYIHSEETHPGTQIFIPANTVHASGRNQLVLELGSVMRGAYTYKVYDYQRTDINGMRRPIHIKLAEQSLDLSRDAKWVKENVALAPVLQKETADFAEYKIGAYPEIDYETYKININENKCYTSDNKDFTVVALVDGESVKITDSSDKSKNYNAKYLDVVIIPNTIKNYSIVNDCNQKAVIHKTIIKGDSGK